MPVIMRNVYHNLAHSGSVCGHSLYQFVTSKMYGMQLIVSAVGIISYRYVSQKDAFVLHRSTQQTRCVLGSAHNNTPPPDVRSYATCTFFTRLIQASASVSPHVARTHRRTVYHTVPGRKRGEESGDSLCFLSI